MKKIILNTVIALAASTVAFSCNRSNAIADPTQNGVITFENVTEVKHFVQSGTFQGAGTPPVIFPGQSTSITFHAGKGQYVAFATMYGLSKDWFFAPENPGLKLYDDAGNAITGDVSAQIRLWDNGSKDDVTGATESKDIAQVAGIDASSLMKLDLAYAKETSQFTLTIRNVSGGTAHETPFSPGVWAVSNLLGGKLLNETPFFEAGKKSNAEITPIAEKGDNSLAAAKVAANTGIITVLSPLVAVVYSGDENPIFKLGEKDPQNGLKDLAQLGHPDKLQASLKAHSRVKEVYVLGNGPIVPGAKVTANIKRVAGDKVAFVSMFGYSNDWFFANNAALTLESKGDVSSLVTLYDDGTARDQYPGAGNAQALFEGKAIDENLNIKAVESEFPVQPVNKILKITIN